MSDSFNGKHVNGTIGPQCQFFVVRKKRLCRMTVKPGRQYCGEHEPAPKTADGLDDTRIPCPNDPKHTCYISKLEKHLSICNARATPQPSYIVHNINSPPEIEVCHRKPLAQLSKETVLKVIEKVNALYDEHIKDQITTEPEHPIHTSVLGAFSESDRAESSLRHLRQVSSLLWLAEREGMVGDGTCYVELGAGKGQVSYYACTAWCAPGGRSAALLVDRASLRHKRDNALRGRAVRLRADIAHLALPRVPVVAASDAVVALAKHLCGVATDLALRCLTAPALPRALALALATCCHHRCQRAAYVANEQLMELGISGEELNVMLGIVSWATCGDGRSRDKRNRTLDTDHAQSQQQPQDNSEHDTERSKQLKVEENDTVHTSTEHNRENKQVTETNPEIEHKERLVLSQEYREEVGRRAKQLLDWGRVLFLRERGFDARLCYYVSTAVSLENVCIVAKKLS